MTNASQRVHALRIEEIGLLQKLETVREQLRLQSASEAMLQANLTTVRAKLAGVAMGEEAAREAAAVTAAAERESTAE